ncbi:flavodoxin family protein [Nocardioides sp. GXQ0305]|uniref:flavodoxin family protein n=1 Tax=Nocardioides sp. GXQ0305 TaxID=3423912 RepID=UPI003D7E4C37
MARLLVVHHSPTRATRQLTDRVVAGAHDDAITGVEVEVLPALEADRADPADADGFLLGTSANFGYMSGALKHFFDRHFLALGGALADDGSGAPVTGGRKPYGLWVHGRYDTTGAVRSVQAIAGALPWRQASEVLEVLGDVGEEQLEAAYELGGTIAALLAD